MADETTTTTTSTPQNTDTQQSQNAATGTQDSPTITAGKLKERLEQKQRAILKELGFDDLDTAKKTLEEATRVKAASMSENEKRDAENAALKAELEKTKLEREKLEAARKMDRVADAIKDAAIEAKAHNAARVVAMLKADGDFDDLLEGDTPNTKAITAKIEALKKSDAYLFSHGEQGSPSNRNGQVNTDTAVLTADELATAGAFGVTPESFARAKAVQGQNRLIK